MPSAGTEASRQGAHIASLDGVRGVAILVVMLGHFVFYGGMERALTVDRYFYKAATTGWFGVDLFFVLSGFLITGILYDTKGSSSFFRTFYARRTLRIFPLYYGFLFAFFFVRPLVIAESAEFAVLRSQQGWYWSYLSNVKFALDGWPARTDLGHFWSLAVEEQFYLVWPLFVFALGRRALCVICGVAIAGALAFRCTMPLVATPLWAYVLTPARMDALAVGALLALWSRGPGGLRAARRWAWPVLVACLLPLLAVFVWRGRLTYGDPVIYTGGFTLIAFGCGAVLVLALSGPADGGLAVRVMSCGALRFLGRYSYALYVFHHPVVHVMRRRGIQIRNFPDVMGSDIPAALAYIGLAGGISLALALASWYFWELPFLKLKRLLPYSRPTRSAA